MTINSIIKRRIIEISQFHLPQNEYENLDKAMDVDENDYAFVAAIYNVGVIVYVAKTHVLSSEKVDNTKRDFPVLYSLLLTCAEKDIMYIDFFIDAATLEEFKIYTWE